jgi:hypothetical protein
MNTVAKMSKWLPVCGLCVGIVAFGFASGAYAQRVVRDPTVSTAPVPPKIAPAVSAPEPRLPKLTAAQIVDKNVAARGGLGKWHAVQSITMSGQMDAGGKVDTMLPYTLQMKRPNKQRLAIEFAGQTSLQVFDGEHGWKVRPYLNRTTAEPFSADELQQTNEAAGIDGPLVDYAAKGSKVELEGTETVQGKATYRLKLTTKQGRATHIWIDGTTFLEAKMEGRPRRSDGKMRPVQTFLSDYRQVDGVMIPFVAETQVEGWRATHKMIVDKVALNKPIDDTAFAKPADAPATHPQRVFVDSTAAKAPAASAPEAPKSN